MPECVDSLNKALQVTLKQNMLLEASQHVQHPVEERPSTAPTSKDEDAVLPRLTKSAKRRAKARQRALAGTNRACGVLLRSC